LSAHSARGLLQSNTVTVCRKLGEINIAGYQRGFARQGLDFWPVIPGIRGKKPIAARYPESDWRNTNIKSFFLSPGKNGAVSTQRFEMIREGVEECEARIFIEKALFDKNLRAKIPEELAKRCRTILDERIPKLRLGTSSLVLDGGWTTLAPAPTDWWGRGAGQMGHYWYVGSGWEARSAELYSAAAEVAKALADR